MADYHRLMAAQGISPLDDPHEYRSDDLDDSILHGLTAARDLGIVEVHDAALGHWDYLDALERLVTQGTCRCGFGCS